MSNLKLAAHLSVPATIAELHKSVRDKLSSAQQKLYDTLMEAKYAGEEVLDSPTLADRSGYTVNGHFNNLRGSLHTLDVVQYVKGGTSLSDWLFPAELS